MEIKSNIAMIVGVALVLATAATVYTQSAFAGRTATNTNNGGNAGVAGTTDGQTEHGLATACSHTNVAAHNPHCGQTPTGGNNIQGGKVGIF
jgi:hypothetical protein